MDPRQLLARLAELKAEGDAIQYIIRQKGSRIENLNKAIHVLQMLLEIEND